MSVKTVGDQEEENNVINQLREELHSSLRSRRIKSTPQALSALAESINRAYIELLGQTDSVLLGLLYSGSYTVDLLEAAGVEVSHLRNIVDRCNKKYEEVHLDDWPGSAPQAWLGDSVASLVHSQVLEKAIKLAKRDRGPLETAHLLVSAIEPTQKKVESVDSFLREFSFPTKSLKAQLTKSDLQNSMIITVADIIAEAVGFITKKPLQMLSQRNTLLTQEEELRLDKKFGAHYPEMTIEEFEFILAAVNTWFSRKRILTDPPVICLQTVNRCGDLFFGPQFFAEAGGDIKALDIGLDVSKRFSPERDLAGLALFEREGRIQIGQYTYRNTFLVDTEISKGYPIRRVGLQAVRPASLVSVDVIASLETILSRENLNELEIQNFLMKHPEILQALGYAAVRPHVCLYTENKEKLIPDFLLEIPGGGFDILDLKLPLARLAIRQPYVHMSNQLSKAIGQLYKYAKFFDNARNRKEFIRRYGLEPFKPELTVVIGRNDEFRSKDERLEIEEQLGKIRLLTYDDLIAYGNTRSIILPEQI